MAKGWQTSGRSPRDRKRRKARPQSRQPAPGQSPPSQQTAVQRPVSSNVTLASARTTRLSATTISIRPEDYSYIYGDLKRIAFIALSIFAILIILSFVIK